MPFLLINLFDLLQLAAVSAVNDFFRNSISCPNAAFKGLCADIFIFIGIGGCFVPRGTDRLFQKGVAFHDTLSGSLLACAGIDLGGGPFFAKSKLLSTGFCLVGIGQKLLPARSHSKSGCALVFGNL